MRKRSSKPGNKASVSKEPRGRARRILNLENPDPPLAEENGFQAFVEAEAKKAGLTVDEWNEKYSPSLSEVPWAGGRERDKSGKEEELEALVANGLTAHDPLELLLIAVRRATYPAEKPNERELAIRHAKKHLTGEPVPGGHPPPSNREEVCRAIAPDYFAKSLRMSLSALLKAKLGLIDTDLVTRRANDRKIERYMDYFNANMDRLMSRVSSGKYEDLRRRANFLRALESLRECGVEVDPD
jgi:hypothetical protein